MRRARRRSLPEPPRRQEEKRIKRGTVSSSFLCVSWHSWRFKSFLRSVKPANSASGNWSDCRVVWRIEWSRYVASLFSVRRAVREIGKCGKRRRRSNQWLRMCGRWVRLPVYPFDRRRRSPLAPSLWSMADQSECVLREAQKKCNIAANFCLISRLSARFDDRNLGNMAIVQPFHPAVCWMLRTAGTAMRMSTPGWLGMTTVPLKR